MKIFAPGEGIVILNRISRTNVGFDNRESAFLAARAIFLTNPLNNAGAEEGNSRGAAAFDGCVDNVVVKTVDSRR